MWDDFQRRRLNYEVQTLLENHSHCEPWIGDNWAVVRIWQYVAGSWYHLRVEVSESYPDQKPKIYVQHPVPLLAYWQGKTISDYAPSHNYHVLSTSAAGEVQICHFADGDWDARKTIHLVVLKAKLWLQAYAEHHLRTGKPICDFFNDCIG